MTKYREILRLTALGLSQRDICSSAGVSQKTVSKVQKRARELHCILRSPTAIVAMLNDRTAELIGQSENHYSTVFLT